MADSISLRASVEYCDIAALRDAYAKMQALSATDNRSRIYWANIHGFPDYDCWHHALEGPAQHRSRMICCPGTEHILSIGKRSHGPERRCHSAVVGLDLGPVAESAW